MASYIEILESHGITQKVWDRSILMGYLRAAFWPLFMGKSEQSVIQVKSELNGKKGSTIVFELAGELEGGVVTGNQTGIGNEGSFDVYVDEVTVDNIRIIARIDDVTMTEQRSGMDALKLAKSRIMRKAQVRLDSEITTALADTSNGRIRDRYLYGAVDSNWNATHATALTAVDNTADKLTLKGISKAKRKATSPTYVDIPKIMPTATKGAADKLVEWFIYIAGERSIRDLTESDASFLNRQLNIPPEPNSDNPLYTGSSFRGAHDGVLIHRYDEIPYESSTIVCEHNLLLGAQALGYAVVGGPKFNSEDVDLGHSLRTEIHEVRGMEKLVFDEANAQDHGVVHHFVAAVADA
jgi:N4-gp56 family major capsid protein